MTPMAATCVVICAVVAAGIGTYRVAALVKRRPDEPGLLVALLACCFLFGLLGGTAAAQVILLLP